ncbi:MAG: DJ-1/PfpI family protein [Treponema sp.]|nr:DJ-1/PfpI family protein [Treponema sp.]
MKNVAVFLAPGFEEIEALTPVDYLRRAGVNVIMVSVPETGSEEMSYAVRGSHGITVFADTTLVEYLDEADKALPDAVFFPGGLQGATHLAANDDLRLLIQRMDGEGKIVSSVCASPAMVLSRSGVLAGKKWTCYPGMNENLSEYCGGEEAAKKLTEGASHVAGVPFVFDKNLLTGRGPGTAEQFSMKLVELLSGEEVAKTIHDGSCLR